MSGARDHLPGAARRGGGRGDAAQALAETDLYLPVPQYGLVCFVGVVVTIVSAFQFGGDGWRPLRAPWTGKTARCP